MNLQRAPVDRRLELRCEALAHAAVGAVRGQNEISRRQPGRVDLGLETQHDAQLGRPLLQDAQELAARDAAEAVARSSGCALPRKKMSMSVQYANRDVIARWVSGSASSKSPSVSSEKHDAPAERVVGLVALAHRDLVRGSSRFMRMAK